MQGKIKFHTVTLYQTWQKLLFLYSSWYSCQESVVMNAEVTVY